MELEQVKLSFLKCEATLVEAWVGLLKHPSPPNGMTPVHLVIKVNIRAWFLNDPNGGGTLLGGQKCWLAVPLFPKVWQPNIWNTNLTALRENMNSGYALTKQSTAMELLVWCFIHSIITPSLLDWALLATVQYIRPRPWAWSTRESIPASLSARWNPSIFQGLV